MYTDHNSWMKKKLVTDLLMEIVVEELKMDLETKGLALANTVTEQAEILLQ